MNTSTKTGLAIIQAALVLGVLADVMLRVTPWGVNVLLFNLAFTAAIAAVAVRYKPEFLNLRNGSLMLALLFFASMFAVRDSIELRVADTFAIVIMMGVLIISNFGINQRIGGIFHYAAGVIIAGFSSLISPFLLLGADIDWKAMPGNRLSKNIFSVLRGLAVALPLIIIFGALFMAADAAYENLANRAINFDLGTVISHVLLSSLFAWLTAGYLRGTLVEQFHAAVPVEPLTTATDDKTSESKAEADGSFVERFAAEPAENTSLPNNASILEHINLSDPPNKPDAAVEPEVEKPKRRDWQEWDNSSFPHVFTLGTVETVIIIGLIDLLFLSFVIVQIPYLFGGMELVQNTPDFKLADYARRGFGELVTVAALVLPILLASHWLLRRENVRNELIFKVLAGIQIGLLFVIMASAVQRLVLLTGELGYGLTTVRLYPMIFMSWLAAVFVWFAVTVLRGRRQYFAWGALWSAIFVLGMTNLGNPDAFIARTNVDLMQRGRDFDASYQTQLSDDALPVLFDSIGKLSEHDQQTIARHIERRFCQHNRDEMDLRSWNLARWRAFDRIASDPLLVSEIGDCSRIAIPYRSDD